MDWNSKILLQSNTVTRPISSNLCERGHSLHLPDYDTVLFKKFIIVGSLYKFVTHN